MFAYRVRLIHDCEAQSVPIQNAAPRAATNTMEATQVAPRALALGTA